MKVVLDTNVLLVSIPKKSQYRSIFDTMISGKLSVLISNEILVEYEEVIGNKTNQTVAKNIIELLITLQSVQKVEPFYKWNLIAEDESDNKFVDCAIAGNADYIVTNDKLFERLKKISFPKVNFITIDKFLKLI